MCRRLPNAEYRFNDPTTSAAAYRFVRAKWAGTHIIRMSDALRAGVRGQPMGHNRVGAYMARIRHIAIASDEHTELPEGLGAPCIAGRDVIPAPAGHRMT
jgi:hypothetical protein